MAYLRLIYRLAMDPCLRHYLIQKYFSIYNVLCFWLCMFRIPDCLDPMNRSGSGNSYIKLPMSKNRSTQVKSNIFHRLALRFIDGHGKGQRDRKLASAEFKWKLGIRRAE